MQGLRYRIQTDKTIDGNAHGIAYCGRWPVRSVIDAFQIWRRPSGGGTWEAVGDPVDADQYGMWDSGTLQEFNPADNLRWDYGISQAGYTMDPTDLGIAPVREYIAWGAYRTLGGNAVSMTKSPVGTTKYTATIYRGSIFVYRQKALTTWEVLPTVDTTGQYDSVGVEHDGGVLTVTGRNTNTHVVYQWYSYNEGALWYGPIAVNP